MIRIENFPSFVISKAQFYSRRITAYGTEWYIGIRLYKYCQTSKANILVTPSSIDQPETLGASVCGERSDQKECSFDVGATFKFMQPATVREDQLLQKFYFNSTKYYDGWGLRNFGRIDVILLCYLLINF